MPTEKIAVLGLGAMGMGMAKSLLRAGFEVRGFDIVAARREEFAGAGGSAVESAAEAARGVDAVVSVVLNAEQTEAVLFGKGNVAEIMPAGAVFISSATVAPRFAEESARRLEAIGRHYLDAPISGGAAKAAEGALTIMASGSPAAMAQAEPALAAMAQKVYRLGDKPGIGSAFKIVNQLLAGVHVAAACEGVAFAAKLGLDLAQVYEVISASAGSSWMFQNRVPHILEGDYRPLSAVNIWTKDLGIVLDIARTEKFPVPLAGAALQMYLMTAAAGMGPDDDSSVARLYAQMTGVTLPRGAAND